MYLLPTGGSTYYCVSKQIAIFENITHSVGRNTAYLGKHLRHSLGTLELMGSHTRGDQSEKMVSSESTLLPIVIVI